jgi:hypothetical protein
MIITVENELQKILLISYLIDEIQFGFWSEKSPPKHVKDWDDVEIKITETGEVGVSHPLSRRYNFLSQEFVDEHLIEIRDTIRTEYQDVSISVIRKNLKALGDICGGRLTSTEKGAVVAKREILDDAISFKSNYVAPIDTTPVHFETYQSKFLNGKILPFGFFDDYLFSELDQNYLTMEQIHETIKT